MEVMSFHKHQSAQCLAGMAGLEPHQVPIPAWQLPSGSQSHGKGHRQINTCQKQIKQGCVCTLATLLHSRFVYHEPEGDIWSLSQL